MNLKLKFLEIMLSDLISERDSYEMDLNIFIGLEIETSEKKIKINKILDNIALINNKIEILSELITSLGDYSNKDENNNNNN